MCHLRTQRTALRDVCVCGVWLPCEYFVANGKVVISSVGDVECEAVAQEYELDAAIAEAFKAIPDFRRLVILVPQENKAIADWPWRRVLKKTLIPNGGGSPGTQS